MAGRRRAALRGQAPVRVGDERLNSDGSVWQVRAYKATASCPRGYVQYKDVESGAWRIARPKQGETLHECFTRVEKAMDANVSLARSSATGEDRTMAALVKRYEDYLRKRGRDSNYIYHRIALCDLWVTRFMLADGTRFGDLLVADWSTDQSEEVIAHAKTKLSAARVEDIGSALAGLRKVAQLPLGKARVRWMSPDDNPLEGVEYSRALTHREVAGAHKNYIAPRLRPSTEMVDTAMHVAPEALAGSYMGGVAWMPLCIGIAGYCGLRQAEQLALRAEDIDTDRRVLYVNGRWKYPRNGQPYYRQSFTKTDEIREVPYPESLHPLMLAGVELAKAWQQERAGDGGKDPRRLEAWLFPHAKHGVPPTKEQFNAAWHKVRDAVVESGVAWPTEVKYRNLRHHFAVWANRQGLEWRLVAMLMGDDEQTVRDHYVIPGEEDMVAIRDLMRGL